MWHSHLNVWKFLKQKVLFPKGLNWVQHWASRIGLLAPFSSPFWISRYWRNAHALIHYLTGITAVSLDFAAQSFWCQVLILYISQDDKLSYVDFQFEGFKLALWSTFRQNEAFWLVLAINMTRRPAMALRLPNWSKLTVRFCLDSRLFNFSHHKPPNLMVFSEIFKKRKCLLLPNRNWFSSCKPRELQCSTVTKRRRLWDGFARHLSAIMFFKCHH